MNYEKMRQEWAAGDAVRDAGLTTPEDVIRFDNLSYGPVPVWNLLDIYRPRGTEGLLPVIFSMHGGGLFYGDKDLYQHYCMRLAERGFAVVNYSYRLVPDYPEPAQLEDSFLAYRFMAEHANEYGLDLDNVFFVGDSAGAHLCETAGLMLTNPRFAKRFPQIEIDRRPQVRAVAINCGMATRGGRFLTKDFPPAFVMGAYQDPLKLCVPILSRRLKRKGVEHIGRVYGSKETPEIGHVFHVNCRLPLAAECNDDECAFFRAHIV